MIIFSFADILNIYMERQLLSNNNQQDNENKYWQDRYIKRFFTSGFLTLVLLVILFGTLFFSYNAKPADPNKVEICLSHHNETLTNDCELLYKSTYKSQLDATHFRIFIITVAFLPVFSIILLLFTKHLGILIRAQGASTCLGIFTSLCGLSIILYIASFTFTCLVAYDKNNTLTDKLFCAKSVEPSFRILNNIMILIGFIFISFLIMMLINDWLQLKSNNISITTTYNDRFWYIFSPEARNNVTHSMTHYFIPIEPPPYIPYSCEEDNRQSSDNGI